MKIFQTIEMNMEPSGFIRNQRPFNLKQCDRIVKITLFNALFIYLVHEANTPTQYMESILITTAGILITIAYMSLVFEYATIFKLIDDIEQDVNESKLFH